MKLVITLATRGRSQQLIETVTKSLRNLALPNTVFMLQVDHDDYPTQQAAFNHPWNDSRVKVNIAQREDTIAAKWNRARSEPADVYLCCGDDDPYITPGYDAKILEAASLFDDGIGMVYGLNANLSFSCLVAPTAKLVDLMGFIQPEYFPYWFVDHWTDDLARMINRIAYTDVRTDQSKAGKTQEMREPGWWATWFDAAYRMRQKHAFDIIEKLDIPSNQKELARRLAPSVGLRSRSINDSVRAQEAAWTAMGMVVQDRPERYQRVKNAAISMIPSLLDDYGMDRVEALTFRNALIPPTTIPSIPQVAA